MNEAVVKEMLDGALTGTNSFPEIVAVLLKEGIESYHVDFLRNECRYYSVDGESLIIEVPFPHKIIATDFSIDRLEAINQKVQAGNAKFIDFVNEGTAAGCAYYIVYLIGKKVRYFGRNGDEHIQYFPDSRNKDEHFVKGENIMNRVARSMVKNVDIAANPENVFTFLSDPMNWTQYAVVNLRSVTPGEDGWFKVVTKFGEGGIKMSPVQEFGVLDHIWKDPHASWTVFSRVVPNSQGATFMMTFFQPPIMSDEQFDQAMQEIDVEMMKLKEILEVRQL